MLTELPEEIHPLIVEFLSNRAKASLACTTHYWRLQCAANPSPNIAPEVHLQTTAYKMKESILTVIRTPRYLSLCTPPTLQQWGIRHAEAALLLIEMGHPVTTSTLLLWGQAHETVAQKIVELAATDHSKIPLLIPIKLAQKHPSIRTLIENTPTLFNKLNSLQKKSLAASTSCRAKP